MNPVPRVNAGQWILEGRERTGSEAREFWKQNYFQLIVLFALSEGSSVKQSGSGIDVVLLSDSFLQYAKKYLR